MKGTLILSMLFNLLLLLLVIGYRDLADRCMTIAESVL